MGSEDNGGAGTKRTAVIIGAGPAGLTAALELLLRTDVLPIVIEASDAVGGLSRTVEYKGNRLDIGGHRFFSKSERVMRWWQERMPREDSAGAMGSDAVLLVRERQSRIYFLQRFFDYPLRLTADTLRKLGLRRVLRIALSYAAARLRPRRPERSLEDFLLNRFGRELYRTFFESYTEKVWGVPCREIGAAWGAQRIRGLSLTGVVRDWVRRSRRPAAEAGERDQHGKQKRRSKGSRCADVEQSMGVPRPENVTQCGTETSLIERFLYPRLGPGQMWEMVAREVIARGGVLHCRAQVERLCAVEDGIHAVEVVLADGSRQRMDADFVLSTMPVPALVRSLSQPAPANVREVCDGLRYRDFLTVGVLARTLALAERDGSPLRDNWIYIQEPGVRMTRLQLFHNWSPALVAEPGNMWLGLEYVCTEGDGLWSMSDDDLQRFALRELEGMGLLRPDAVLDGCVVRAPRAYPAYLGTYDRFPEVQQYLARFHNLFPLGRNGMHRYNNQDHSMLTAMLAVDQIAAGTFRPEALWSVNTEQSYHESQ